MANTVATPKTSLRMTPSSISQSSVGANLPMSGSPHRINFASDAVLDDGHAAALLGLSKKVERVRTCIAWLGLTVGQRAQGQRQALAHFLGDGQNLGLLRGELQCGGLADDDLLATLVFDRLVDGEDANIVQDGFGRELWGRGGPAAIGRSRHLTR